MLAALPGGFAQGTGAFEVCAEGLAGGLVAELGLEPGPALLELERQILNHGPVLLAAPREEAVGWAGRLRTTLPRARRPELIGRVSGGSGRAAAARLCEGAFASGP
jgi:hypothetical protein